MFEEILDRDLLVVMGKGGVGKSTVVGATGLLAAERGKKTLLVSLYEPRLLASSFGVTAIKKELTPLSRRLYGIWLDQDDTFDDFIRSVIKLKMLYRRLMDSLFYKYFTAALPGLKELTVLDRIATILNSAQDSHGGRPFDLVIVDGPATGHGSSLLEVPEAAISGLSMGPIKKMAMRLQRLLKNPVRTGALVVSLAEEMPVSETIELIERIEKGPETPISGVVVNNFTPPPFESEALAVEFEEWSRAVERHSDTGAGNEGARVLYEAGRFQQSRWQVNAHHMKRLRERLDVPQFYVPFVTSDSTEGKRVIDRVGSFLGEDESSTDDSYRSTLLSRLHTESAI